MLNTKFCQKLRHWPKVKDCFIDMQMPIAKHLSLAGRGVGGGGGDRVHHSDFWKGAALG